jgi:2-(1,2-epoxy-1,2-dihydrophenyl)acetyl-CoA isomerase
MSYRTLTLDRDAGALRVTLNRPDVLNALSLELLGELRDALEDAAADRGVRAVLLTGAGRGFSAGADLASTSVDADIGHIIETYYNPVARLLATMPKPVVAGVNGVAAGAGMSLALACDLRLLSQHAAFVLGFTGIALVLDASGSYFLPRLVGRARALELAYSNRKVGAEEALGLGLGERVLPAETFEADAWAFARTLAQGPTKSYALIKRQFFDQDAFERQLALEARLQTEAAQSADAREGVLAFTERRKPVFRGE